MTRAQIRRLASKFTVGDGCWGWQAYKDPNGYGRIRTLGKTYLAHRVVYEWLVGLIPEGLELDHLCRNPSCVRPDHLEIVTHAENVRRGDAGAHYGRRTTCKWGHKFEGSNLFTDATGARRCRLCKIEIGKRYTAKRLINA